MAAELDPLKLLEEIRAVQAYLAALADGDVLPPTTSEPPNLAEFIASLTSAWRGGEIRPTFSMEVNPRYLRGLQKISPPTVLETPNVAAKEGLQTEGTATSAIGAALPTPVYAEAGNARIQALRMVWPIACRRLEEFPNINAMQLFEELCIQFPGRFTRKQYKTFVRHVARWRDCRATFRVRKRDKQDENPAFRDWRRA